MKSKITVVKIGGNIIDDEGKLKDFLEKFIALDGSKILVHGGGKLATELAEKMNVPVKMHEGRRITDAETLKIATMVYAGHINKTIVALLQGGGCNAIGLSGADGNCIRTKKRPPRPPFGGSTELSNPPMDRTIESPSFGGVGEAIDFGFVGDIHDNSVNVPFFADLVDKNICPVISPITHDNYGQLLNTNADTIASAIAIALSNFYDVELVYCFEKKGVLENINDESSVICEIDAEKYLNLKKTGVISQGMIPKLDNAFDAIKKGVTAVRIGSAEQLLELIKQNHNEGTRLYA